MDWYDNLDANIRATFDTRLRYLREQEQHKWSMPYFKLLHGRCCGIGEIRFQVRRIQYRPLGYFGPMNHQFTLLVGAIEKNNRFVPKSVCKTALNYIGTLENQSGGKVDDWDS